MVSGSTAASPERHTLPVEWFQELASGSGSAPITDYLWTTERSRRLLLVNALLEEAEQRPELLGPLPSAGSARALIERAQSLDQGAVNTVLMDPQLGSWAAYSLRRQHGRAVSSLPVWADWGAIHSLALVVAARTGLRWRTRIPLRHGAAMLPTLGMVRFPEEEPAAVAEAFTESGRIVVAYGETDVAVPADPEGDREGWWALRAIHVADDLPLTVTIDDINPFRDLADPIPPERLDDVGFARWTSLVRDAWSLLCRDHRDEAAAMAKGIVSLVPIRPTSSGETRSASTGEAFGSVLTSEPPDAVDMAVTLVHEYQHIKLGALIHLVKLTGDDDGTLLYAPWRDDPRPLGGLLQGVYAFAGIAEFWRRRRDSARGTDSAVAEFEFAYARGQVDAALRAIHGQPGLTPSGQRVVDGLTSRLSSWLAEPVAPEIARLAELTSASHRLGWLLRHTRPDPAEVLELTERRLAPGAASDRRFASASLMPHRELFWPHRIPALARRQVIARVQGGVPRSLIPDEEPRSPLTRADEALVRGDAPYALDCYREWILDNPSAAYSHDAVRAWAGLALASARSGQCKAAAILNSRPDLVKGVHALLAAERGAGDPLELAEWLTAFGGRA